MERTEVLELMATLKLYGMRAAYDEVMAIGIKRRYEPPRIVGDLLSAEIAEKQARSIKYQLTIAKLSLLRRFSLARRCTASRAISGSRQRMPPHLHPKRDTRSS
jgi:hypothetical protein